MNDLEIKKALEYCINCVCNTIDGEDDCPLLKMSFCKNYLMEQSLDLINRQGEEKESLKAEVERLKETIEVLRPVVEQSHIIRKGGKSPLSLIKAEAYKECIEKVKEKSKKTEVVASGALIAISYAISAKNLDNLLNELVGDKNAGEN